MARRLSAERRVAAGELHGILRVASDDLVAAMDSTAKVGAALLNAREYLPAATSDLLQRDLDAVVEKMIALSEDLRGVRSFPIAGREASRSAASRRTAVQYDSDGYPVECLYSDGYGDSPYGLCSGGAELFPAPSGTGTMIGYCPKHYDKALERDRETRDRLGNPDSDFAPDWLDPADIGERWDYDY